MNFQKIDQKRVSDRLGIDVCHFPEVDSTSLYVKRLISNGENPPVLTIAEAQTNGQGRIGKTFYSPSDTGLYMTFAFLETEVICHDLTPRIALAVSKAIEMIFKIECKVKWVNDVYYNGRKVSGVLVQKVDNYFLIGIGINVEKPKEVPLELEKRFGYLCEKCDQSLYEDLIEQIYFSLKEVFLFSKKDVLSEYRNRCLHVGREVLLEQNGETLCGTCVGISDDFLLMVERSGKIFEYSSGYMTLKIEI
jgi:BirA family biotin operon repressor/biotin-[acetyl-CoA-carboxylase] ligase